MNSSAQEGGTFNSYRAEFVARLPDLTRMSNEDELALIGNEVVDVEGGPGEFKGVIGSVNEDNCKYLWVVAPSSCPISLEFSDSGKALKRGRLSHTNLTGGEQAHSGGELWFVDENAIVINGGSSRYQPRNNAELEKVALAYKSVGFRVASMGWDEETDKPVRTLRGKPKWI